MAHVRLVLCDSYGCKFKEFCAFITYKKKVKKGQSQGLQHFLLHCAIYLEILYKLVEFKIKVTIKCIL